MTSYSDIWVIFEHIVHERNAALRNKTIEIRALCKLYCQLQFAKNR